MKHMLKDLLRLTGSVCFFLRISRDGENAASLERKNVCTFTYPYSEIKLRKVAAGTPPDNTRVNPAQEPSCSLTWKQLQKHVKLEMAILYSSGILDLILAANFSDHTGI